MSIHNIKKQSRRLTKFWSEIKDYRLSENLTLSNAQEIVARQFGYANYFQATKAAENITEQQTEESLNDVTSNAASESDRLFFNAESSLVPGAIATNFVHLCSLADLHREAPDPDNPLLDERIVDLGEIDFGLAKAHSYLVFIGGRRPKDLETQTEDFVRDQKLVLSTVPDSFILTVFDEVENFESLKLEAMPFVNAFEHVFDYNPKLIQALKDNGCSRGALFEMGFSGKCLGNLVFNKRGNESQMWVFSMDDKLDKPHWFTQVDLKLYNLMDDIVKAGKTTWLQRLSLLMMKPWRHDMSRKLGYRVATDGGERNKVFFENAFLVAFSALYLTPIGGRVKMDQGSLVQEMTFDLARFHVLPAIASRSVIAN